MKKTNKKLKIAIFHDDLSYFGGGEKTILILAKHLQADLYTYSLSKDLRELVKNIKLTTLSENKATDFKKIVRAFKDVKLKSKYDLFIFSGNLCIYSASNYSPKILYIPIIPHNFHVNSRFFDLIRKVKYSFYLKKFDSLITNSFFTRNVLSKTFFLHTIVINPPINTRNFNYVKHTNYWVSTNRIDPQKRILMQIEAFKLLPKEKLYICGDINNYKYSNFLTKIKPYNVEFVGNLSEKNLANLISSSKGAIFTSKSEAFGMAAVEAMASGKPVIAPNEGGYKETIIDGVTGKLIDDINPDKLANAIVEMDKELKKNPLKYKNACIKQAKKFDKKIFIKKIKEEINNVMKEYEKKEFRK